MVNIRAELQPLFRDFIKFTNMYRISFRNSSQISSQNKLIYISMLWKILPRLTSEQYLQIMAICFNSAITKHFLLEQLRDPSGFLALYRCIYYWSILFKTEGIKNINTYFY